MKDVGAIVIICLVSVLLYEGEASARPDSSHTTATPQFHDASLNQGLLTERAVSRAQTRLTALRLPDARQLTNAAPNRACGLFANLRTVVSACQEINADLQRDLNCLKRIAAQPGRVTPGILQLQNTIAGQLNALLMVNDAFENRGRQFATYRNSRPGQECVSRVTGAVSCLRITSSLAEQLGTIQASDAAIRVQREGEGAVQRGTTSTAALPDVCRHIAERGQPGQSQPARPARSGQNR